MGEHGLGFRVSGLGFKEHGLEYKKHVHPCIWHNIPPHNKYGRATFLFLIPATHTHTLATERHNRPSDTWQIDRHARAREMAERERDDRQTDMAERDRPVRRRRRCRGRKTLGAASACGPRS